MTKKPTKNLSRVSGKQADANQAKAIIQLQRKLRSFLKCLRLNGII